MDGEWCDGIVPMIDAGPTGYEHAAPAFDRSLRTAAELMAERSIDGQPAEVAVGRQ